MTDPTNPGLSTPVVPDYQGAGLTNIVPALLAQVTGGGGTSGAPPAWLPDLVHGARQIVLLVVDGLGWEQLRARPTLAPTLSGADGIGRPATSVVPTTTACALTSIATGRTPADHGVIGYRLSVGDDEVLNVLRWTIGSGHSHDARRRVPAEEFQPYAPFPGSPHRVPVVSRAEFGGTGFTAAHLGDSPLHGYRMPSTLTVEVARLLGAGEPFVYAYYDGVDKVAHEYGLGEHYDAELLAIDRLVADLVGTLPSGAVLVVTADHGQVEVGPNVELLGPEIMSDVRFVSGEGRFRWLHARPGATADLLATATELHASTTWVKSRDCLVDEGWFGGPLRDGVANRLGDVALIPFAPIAFLDPADTGETRLASRHGSLTADEMLVPLVALVNDGNI